MPNLATEVSSPTPGFRLLPELVLRSIFWFVAFTTNAWTQDVISISHVNHHWRETSRSYALLWTHIDLSLRGSEALIGLFRSLSRDLPLHVIPPRAYFGWPRLDYEPVGSAELVQKKQLYALLSPPGSRIRMTCSVLGLPDASAGTLLPRPKLVIEARHPRDNRSHADLPVEVLPRASTIRLHDVDLYDGFTHQWNPVAMQYETCAPKRTELTHLSLEHTNPFALGYTLECLNLHRLSVLALDGVVWRGLDERNASISEGLNVSELRLKDCDPYVVETVLGGVNPNSLERLLLASLSAEHSVGEDMVMLSEYDPLDESLSSVINQRALWELAARWVNLKDLRFCAPEHIVHRFLGIFDAEKRTAWLTMHAPEVVYATAAEIEPVPSLESLTIQTSQSAGVSTRWGGVKEMQGALQATVESRRVPRDVVEFGTISNLKTLRVNGRLVRSDRGTGRLAMPISSETRGGAQWYAKQVEVFKILEDGDYGLWNVRR